MLLLPFATNASEIFRWTDENGVVHFSDTRPGDDKEVQELYISESNPPDYDPQSDPYSILNQAKRVNETWTELEQQREERRETTEQYAERQPSRFIILDNRYRYPYLYYAAPNRGIVGDPTRVQRRQFARLEELGLTGPRPHSINSGAHHARVTTSNDIRNVVSRPSQ